MVPPEPKNKPWPPRDRHFTKHHRKGQKTLRITPTITIAVKISKSCPLAAVGRYRCAGQKKTVQRYNGESAYGEGQNLTVQAKQLLGAADLEAAIWFLGK